MATTKKSEPTIEEYIPKAIITKISATSRGSIKIKDGNYFTVEYSEERVIKDTKDIDIDLEREALWDAVNNECDNQIEILLKG